MNTPPGRSRRNAVAQARRRSSSVSRCDTEQQAITTASNASPVPGQSRMSPSTSDTRSRTGGSTVSRICAARPSISIDESTPTIRALGRAAANVNATRPEPQAISSTRRGRTRASSRAKNRASSLRSPAYSMS
jgi:hypothetical protein